MANPTRQILTPFQIGPHGGVAYTENPVNQAIHRLNAIIRTRPGERLMLPTFGSPAADYVFEMNDDIAAAELAMRIAEAVQTYETGVLIREVLPVMAERSSATMLIDVKFSVPPQDRVFSTLVGVGGEMMGTIGG